MDQFDDLGLKMKKIAPSIISKNITKQIEKKFKKTKSYHRDLIKKEAEEELKRMQDVISQMEKFEKF